MKSKTILGADDATKMRQITVGIHGKGGEAGINYHAGSKERYRLCRLQTQGNAQESTKGQHKAHKAYYQEVRERENHKRAVTKEHTELDGTRRTRRQLQPTKENRNAGRGSHRKGCLSGRMQERVHE